MMEREGCSRCGNAAESTEETKVPEDAGSAGCRRMPLSMVHAGETVRVCRIKGDDAFSRHLATLGFVAGAEVSVVSRAAGDVIVEVKGAQLGINRQTASHIITC